MCGVYARTAYYVNAIVAFDFFWDYAEMDFMVKRVITDAEILLKRAVGLRLRAVREAQILTQDELAERAGTSQSAIQKWETGKRYPDSHVLLSICAVLKCDFNWLYQGNASGLSGQLVAQMANRRPETFREPPDASDLPKTKRVRKPKK